MRWYWTIADGFHRDVVVEADGDVAITELARAVGLDLAAVAPGVAGDAAAADVAPLSGATLPAASSWTAPAPALALVVRSGPLAGARAAVRLATTTIGRADDNEIVLADPAVSRHHAELRVQGGDVLIAPLPKARPVLVNGVAITETTRLDPDDIVEIGASAMSVVPAATERADVRREGGGDLAFNRPTRIRSSRPDSTIALPGPRPDAQDTTPLPWAMAAVPVAMSGAMAFVTKQPTMLMMAAASPAMVFANFRTQRRTAGRRRDTTLNRWRVNVSRSERQLSDITDSERREWWRTAPDPATVRDICIAPRSRLWERRRQDPDAVSVRVGVAEVAVPVRLDGQPIRPDQPPPVMSPVPIAVDLARVGVLGIAGPAAAARAVGRWALLQLVAARSPRDLSVVVLCDRAEEHSWEWVRWLPHARVDLAGAPVAQIGNSDETRAARVRELAKEVERRLEARKENREVVFESQIVVLIDGARAYRALGGMAAVLRDGPALGIHAIALDDDRSRLPEEANAEVVIDPTDPSLGWLEMTGYGAVRRMLLDTVSAEVATECARAMTPIRHVGGDGDASELPTAVRFVDLIGIDLDDPEWITTRWALGGRTTRAAIGAGLDGPFSVDLKADGPHALVAGTTGAGKSEFLQTLVVSLAIANRPDSLTFVLVDYKGASAFADCEHLPHTVGMVTNLDNRETERALTSLDAELKRREHELKAMGAKDVDDAWDRDAERAARVGLARLVIVIDEFAELVHELPDFVTGLIRIARVGRSLGVHLILATQRPAGVVSAEMQANVGLRVGLRMVDKADSSEVLGSTESAFISPSTPGRGYVRRGPGNAPDGFQTARVAGRRPGAHAATAQPPVVKTVPWALLGEPLQLRRPRAGGDDPSATDLHALVEVIKAAAARAGVPSNPSPWLPALPDVIGLAELRQQIGPTGEGEPGGSGVLLGLRDVPVEQAQQPLFYRVEDGEHLMIAGSARSGRSSVLRTLIAGLARTWSPDDLHLYGIDFGNGALLPARDLPHCGAVVTGTETARFGRLLGRLIAELARRQLILATDGYGDINEQRSATAGTTAALPYILVVLDRWEGFLGAFPLEQVQELRERVTKILREGPAVGVRLVVAGDRAILSDRIAGFIETRYVLRMAERDDYRLVGIRPNTLPEVIPPGRAYYGDPTNEAQFALLDTEGSGQAQGVALRAEVAAARERFATHTRIRPFRLDVLPAVVTLSTAAELPVVTATDRSFDLLVGVGGDELSQFRADFTVGPGFLVAGQRKLGRSTALATALVGFHRAGVDVLAVVPKTSPLREQAELLGVEAVTTTDAAAAERVSGWTGERERCAVLVDDADVVHGSELDTALIDIIRGRPVGSFALVVAAPSDDIGTLLRGVAVEAKRAKQGVLLSPASSMDGNALGSGIPRNLLVRADPGRALFLFNGEWISLQIPIADRAGT
jgi:S-DNA-T family DNA segregation ATPase FtsK/SpoIIIE